MVFLGVSRSFFALSHAFSKCFTALFHAVSLLFRCCLMAFHCSFVAVSLCFKVFRCCFIVVSLVFHCCLMLFNCCFKMFRYSVSSFFHNQQTGAEGTSLKKSARLRRSSDRIPAHFSSAIHVAGAPETRVNALHQTRRSNHAGWSQWLRGAVTVFPGTASA